jgi:hypothetical protein
VRIYLPATSTLLRQLRAAGEIGPGPLTAFAVTPGLREWYRDDDPEALEYAAMAEAARGSLRLIDADPLAARRRVVIAADMPEPAIQIRDDLDRGVVQVTRALPLPVIASVHVDNADAEPTVAAAAEAVLAAELGDEEAQDRLDDAEGFELAWFATQEIPHLVEGL